MFLIGLQFHRLGQRFIWPTPCLTSALTFRLVVGLCTHVLMFASIRDGAGPPAAVFPALRCVLP